MKSDIVADALNMMKNARNARKDSVTVKKISGLLIEILKIMKAKGAVKGYKINSKEKSVDISFAELSECKAIKPRFTADKDQVEFYRRRYLPARNVGTMLISTNQGLMTHEEAQEEGIGGCLIAYFW
jgi:small subunit ribosomal protein S8